MNTPSTVIYTSEHIWIKSIGYESYEIGITDYAQDLLGDIVFVDTPDLGTQVTKNTAFGVIESVKTASDLIGPLNGTITDINPIIRKSPDTINDKPYETWICKLSSSDDISNKDYFLDASAYQALIG
ncbi:MAG: glycine cleavage system protein GcvH [Candidatus Methylopumilus sp.]|nr:glycine cleavage system protein GcvH [Candidatus Methylopumilus sp.]